MGWDYCSHPIIICFFCIVAFLPEILKASRLNNGDVITHDSSAPKRKLVVPMTLLKHVVSTGAVCLDGSPPAYHYHRGYGSGGRNWLLQFEGGGWCNDLASCRERASTRRGSSQLMNKYENFFGILSNDPSQNPDFYNWNRVKIRYCDGASFGGDSEYIDEKTTLYFRGQRIWKAIIQDLLPKGLGSADKALLSGCSAGGLATFLHCDDFANMLSKATLVKCLSDAGFFLDVADVSGHESIRSFFQGVVTLQGVQKNLNSACLESASFPYECFFPQHVLPKIRTPYFVLNSAYDVYQFHHIFVPSSADPHGIWRQCRLNPSKCNPLQLSTLQGFRDRMLASLDTQSMSDNGGLFINSCFSHCQSEGQDTWFAPNSPMIHNKKIAGVVGDWYFKRNYGKEIDCPYPCDHTCRNIIPRNLTNY